MEVKKNSNPAPDEGDLQKLRRIKQALNYCYAVFLRLPVGNDAEIEGTGQLDRLERTITAAFNPSGPTCAMT